MRQAPTRNRFIARPPIQTSLPRHRDSQYVPRLAQTLAYVAKELTVLSFIKANRRIFRNHMLVLKLSPARASHYKGLLVVHAD